MKEQRDKSVERAARRGAAKPKAKLQQQAESKPPQAESRPIQTDELPKPQGEGMLAAAADSKNSVQPAELPGHGRAAAERIARQRYLELLAETQSPSQLAALIRVIDKVPWDAAAGVDASDAPCLPSFPDIEGMELPQLLAEARKLIAIIEEHSALSTLLSAEDTHKPTGWTENTTTGEAL